MLSITSPTAVEVFREHAIESSKQAERDVLAEQQAMELRHATDGGDLVAQAQAQK